MEAVAAGAPATDRTAAALLSRLRIAVAAISAVILALSGVFRHLDVYEPAWPQLAAFCALLSITAAEAVLAPQRSSWGRARWVAVGVALAASVASCASLPAGETTSSADWAFGAVGWSGVIVLFDRPLRDLVLFLAAHEAIMLTSLLFDGPDLTTVLAFLSGSIGPIGFPLASAIGTTALRGVARSAEESRERAEATRVEESIQAERDKVNQERFIDLSRTAGPLLRGLADGALDPDDPAVQRVCWIEAARMRRLFAEADEVPNPLVHELRQFVDTAGRKAIQAETVVHGEAPEAPVPIRRALAEIVLAALATAATKARVTVLGTSDEVVVHVVCDGHPVDLPAMDGQPIDVEVLWDEGTWWVEARWRTDLSVQ